MKKVLSVVSVIIAVCMLVTMVPLCASAVTETPTVNVALASNTSAVIAASEDITFVSIDTSLASVDIEGSVAYVTALTTEQVTVDAVVNTASGSVDIQLPFSYTTFVFSGDTLTVYEGKDDKYEIAGINMADEEYLEDDATYTLPVEYDSEGNAVYKNSDNYSINVAIKKKGGSYVFCGKSSDMSVCVKKEATANAELILAGLELTSSFTAPITVKKDSTSTVDIVCPKGFINTLTDCEMNNEDLHGEAGTVDTVNPEYAESAVIKGKSAANITLLGEGTLNIISNSKNGIKVSEYGSLTIKELTLNVTSVNHGISSDNVLVINSGIINVLSDGDGIRSDPDTVDAETGAAAEIEITGGNICIIAGFDGIQANQQLTITGGEFCIKTGKGYNDSTFNSDEDSCKGLKVSVNTDDSADTSECTCTLLISGGSFYLNCADDAVHSDAYISITGGAFVILTGDDGVHADTLLEIGTESGTSGLPVINVQTSYEGLEAGTVNIYDGTIRVVASDDGINAAGGSDSTDNNTGFNPGGQRPGMGGNQSTSTASYSINVYGGDIIINASSDGFDSNGALNLLGGEIVVWGATSGDGEPLDHDGNLSINGATVLALGQRGMSNVSSSATQRTIAASVSVKAGQTINVTYNEATVFSTEAVKSCSYVIYSSPEITSTSGWSISAVSSSATSSCAHTSIVVAKLFANDSDCTSGAAYEEVVYCAVCGGEISRKTVTAPSVPEVIVPTEPEEDTTASEITEPEEDTTASEITESSETTTSPAENTDTTTPEDNSSTSEKTEKEYLYGDTDMDSKINIKDATLIQKYLASLSELSDIGLLCADVDANETVNIKDATMIQKYIAGIIEVFPAGISFKL